MIKNYLSDIDGVAIFPVVSFIIFFVSFCLVLLVTYTRRRDVMDAAAAIPLYDESDSQLTHHTSNRYEDQ
jgi:cytochrome c oxidase cbb3-type subunit IV